VPKSIHPTAIVEDGAQLGDGVEVGPYCFVGRRVRLGPGVVLHHGAVVDGDTTLGARTQVFHYAVVGTVPQDKKYQGESSRLEVGEDNVIREHVTIHIGTEGGGGLTRIGHRNLLMGSVHVGHDCQIGNNCVVANGTGLAGHVVLEDYVTLGGQTGIHQFVRVGAHCMTGGGSKVGKDIPPYTIAQGYPARLRGVNHIGLKRRGFSDETVRTLRQVYRAVFFDPEARFDEVMAKARADFQTSVEVARFLDFLAEAQSSDRGFLRPVRSDENGAGAASDDDDWR
jgi:UDP-N-acetylglucosamine acyltransferase